MTGSFDEVLAEYRGLIRSVAHTVRRRYGLPFDLEEMEAAGAEGLLEATRAYDPARGYQFSTFAYYRIRGAIVDNCRRLGQMTRRTGARAAFDAAANAILEDASLNAPAADDTAATVSWLGSVVDDLATAFQVAGGRGEIPDPTPGPEDLAARNESVGRLRAALTSLEPRERTLLKRHYSDGVALSVVAEEMGMSRSWASRLHTQTIKKLRPRMRPPPPLPAVGE